MHRETMFRFVGKFQTVSQSTCTILHSPKVIPVILYLRHQLVFSGFFFFNFSYSNKCVVVFHRFICNSQMINDVKHLSLCLFTNYISSSVKSLLKSLAYFFGGGCCLLIIDKFKCSSYVLIKFFIKYVFCKYFHTILRLVL